MVKCERCGFGYNPPNSNYCGQCGVKLYGNSKSSFSRAGFHKISSSKGKSIGGQSLRSGRKKI